MQLLVELHHRIRVRLVESRKLEGHRKEGLPVGDEYHVAARYEAQRGWVILAHVIGDILEIDVVDAVLRRHLLVLITAEEHYVMQGTP